MLLRRVPVRDFDHNDQVSEQRTGPLTLHGGGCLTRTPVILKRDLRFGMRNEVSSSGQRHSKVVGLTFKPNTGNPKLLHLG